MTYPSRTFIVSVTRQCARRLSSLSLAFTLMAGLGVMPSVAQAQAPLHLVIGFPAGGTIDSLARGIAEQLRTSLNRPIIVENRPGAGGIVATEHVLNAPADGNTLLISPDTAFSLYPLTTHNLPYREADFVPVVHMARYEYALGISMSVPAKTAQEYIDLVRKSPNYGMFGVAGIAGPPQFYGQIFSHALGLKMTTVPYSGVPPILIALQAGQVSAAVTPLGELTRLAQNGNARIIAVVSQTRVAAYPNVPTFAELKAPATQYGQYVIYASAKTPPAKLAPIATAIHDALQTPAVKQLYQNLYMEPTGQTGRALTDMLAEGDRFWAQTAKAYPDITAATNHQ